MFSLEVLDNFILYITQNYFLLVFFFKASGFLYKLPLK